MAVFCSLISVATFCWERGRPGRNAPQARRFVNSPYQAFSRFALIAGGTPAIPVNAMTDGQGAKI